MTRIELAKNLLADDSKLDEEVFIYDNVFFTQSSPWVGYAGLLGQ